MKEKLDEIDENTSAEEAAEIERKFDEMMADADRLTAKIEREERLNGAEDLLERTVERRSGNEDLEPENRADNNPAEITSEQQVAAFRSWAQYGLDGLEQTERQIVNQLRTSLTPEMRAQAVGTGGAGGFTVPEGFLPEITRSMLAWGPMLDPGVTRVIVTTSGNPLPWPGMDDTGNSGALLAENTQDSEQDITFTEKQLDAYKYTSKVIRVSLELLQDSAFNMESEVINPAFGERLGRIGNNHLTVGTGTAQPNGIVTAAAAGITAASATAIAADELLDLQHAVDPAYRDNPGARWMFNDTTFKAIRKLKDGQGNYLWQLGDVRGGAPSTIWEKPYSINQAMASPATTTIPIIFGDFQKYIVRMVRDMTMVRLVERYADFHQVGFIAFMRLDGELSDTAAVKKMTML